MSEEMRRILEMAASGKITQQDAARLLEALGEELPPAPEKPPVPPKPEEEEHRDDEDCQGPSQREVHVEGEGAKPIYQEIAAALDEAAPALERLG